MNFIFLDLEMNTIRGRDIQPIIQVGCCIGDIKTGIVLDVYNKYIKIDEQITDYINKLTGITQEQVNNGISLIEAVKDLHYLKDVYKTHLMIVTWGGGDIDCLKSQYLAAGGQKWEFRRRELDVKTLMQTYCLFKDLNPSGGLKKSLGKLGLQFKDGKAHTADADARNTFYIFLELVKRMNL
jgi:DNA polymerase III alpha subunit (gram-positive type)